MKIEKVSFGKTKSGEMASLYVMKNKNGVELAVKFRL